MKEAFVARQPIFDAALRISGYELLFRTSALENFYRHDDPYEADTRLIHDSFHRFGLDSLVGGRSVYLNASRRALVEGLVRAFPVEQTVIEILENVPPDDEVLEACRALKAQGYSLALDDFVFREELCSFLELADVVKVDFLDPEAEPETVPTRFARPGLRFLAEKIESKQAFEQAKRWGYELFQGYYLQRPEILRWQAPAPSP